MRVKSSSGSLATGGVRGIDEKRGARVPRILFHNFDSVVLEKENSITYWHDFQYAPLKCFGVPARGNASAILAILQWCTSGSKNTTVKRAVLKNRLKCLIAESASLAD